MQISIVVQATDNRPLIAFSSNESAREWIRANGLVSTTRNTQINLIDDLASCAVAARNVAALAYNCGTNFETLRPIYPEVVRA